MVRNSWTALAVSLILVATTSAEVKKERFGPGHARLLEKFADQGIDANEDGILTREEIKAFFNDNPDLRPAGKRGFSFGRHGAWRGNRGFRGPGSPLLHMLNKLEKLDPEQVPEGLLEKHPKLDEDGDGQLSEQEWADYVNRKQEQILAILMKRAPEIDSDEDGHISAEELQEFKAARAAEMQQRILARHPEIDADGDGAVSDEEFEAFKAQRRADRHQRILENHPEADLDGDGILSNEELKEFMDNRPRRGWHHGPDRGPGKPWFEEGSAL